MKTFKEARIASVKTLQTNLKTRRSYAIDAIDRDSFSEDPEKVKKSAKAMQKLISRTMDKKEMLSWAMDELLFRRGK